MFPHRRYIILLFRLGSFLVQVKFQALHLFSLSLNCMNEGLTTCLLAALLGLMARLSSYCCCFWKGYPTNPQSLIGTRKIIHRVCQLGVLHILIHRSSLVILSFSFGVALKMTYGRCFLLLSFAHSFLRLASLLCCLISCTWIQFSILSFSFGVPLKMTHGRCFYLFAVLDLVFSSFSLNSYKLTPYKHTRN